MVDAVMFAHGMDRLPARERLNMARTAMELSMNGLMSVDQAVRSLCQAMNGFKVSPSPDAIAEARAGLARIAGRVSR